MLSNPNPKRKPRQKLQFSQRGVARLIRAARSSGLQVTSIRPDGTVMTTAGKPGETSADAETSENLKDLV